MKRIVSVVLAACAVSGAWAESFASGDWTVTGGKNRVGLAYRGRTLVSELAVGFWNPGYKGMRFAGGGAAAKRAGDTVTFTKSSDQAAMALAVTCSGKTARVTLDVTFRRAPGPFEYGFVLPVASFSGPTGLPFTRLGGAFFPIEPSSVFPARGSKTVSFDLPEACFTLVNRSPAPFVLQDRRKKDEGHIRYIHYEDVDAPCSRHYEHEWTVTDDYDAAAVALRRKSQTEPLVRSTPVPLANAGFEQGFDGWSAAKNMAIDTAVRRTGAASARVTVKDPMKEAVYLTRKVPVVAGARYAASCFVKTENVQEAV